MPRHTITSPPRTGHAPRRAGTRHLGVTDIHLATPRSDAPSPSGSLLGRWSLDADGRLRLEWSLGGRPAAS